MQIARAPQLIAVVYRRLTVSGSQRLVSSVTYMTSRPSETAYFTAFSVVWRRKSSVHPSVNLRIGLDPINVAASMRSPVFCTISAIGRMSFSCVRAGPRSRQSKRQRMDSQRLHQMKDLDLLRDGRIAHRRRLQPIAQGLVVDQHRPWRLQARRVILVPVVDELGSVHGKELLAPSASKTHVGTATCGGSAERSSACVFGSPDAIVPRFVASS